ncbi:hypothetical protein [uncultured Microbulbifer sp.]|uniref:hypothetical protein n=1 Tax=uncultured Microbulbifer sp. TaxID=348147 RepID=UPI0026273153|nr:hypothetical protein [uncultured Microbulbifer sp.]
MNETLLTTDPDFFMKLDAAIKKDLDDEAKIENFICKNWKQYYDLGNPENFEDTESPEYTEYGLDNSEHLHRFEKPLPHTPTISVCHDYRAKKEDLLDASSLMDLVQNAASYEEKLLDFFIHYTFGDGGSHAEGKHYNYALQTAELLEKKSFTQRTFMTRLLCLESIVIPTRQHGPIFEFRCAWDEEHGEYVEIENGKIIKSDYP